MVLIQNAIVSTIIASIATGLAHYLTGTPQTELVVPNPFLDPFRVGNNVTHIYTPIENTTEANVVAAAYALRDGVYFKTNSDVKLELPGPDPMETHMVLHINTERGFNNYRWVVKPFLPYLQGDELLSNEESKEQVKLWVYPKS